MAKRDDLEFLRRALLDWFDRERRPMPWREEPTPYRVWVSEIMLQQTQVRTVTPYFERFMAHFPDLASLAAAGEDEVLALWSGLGYYRRARSLHQSARLLMKEHGGRLPESGAQLANLPGIGSYTAGAIASIAFGRAEAALDGNGVRVLTRLHALAGDPARMPLKAELWRRLGLLVSGERPGDLNQAVMELGARICKPRRPACESCPLAHPCRARAGAGATAYPQLARAASGIVITLAVGLFRRGERVLVQRGDRPLLAGLWNLPYRVLDGGGAFEPESWRQLGLRVANPRPLGREEHSITRYKIRQQVLGGNARLLVREGAPESRWIAAGEQAGLGLPAFSVKLLARYAPDFRAATNHPGSCLDPG